MKIKGISNIGGVCKIREVRNPLSTITSKFRPRLCIGCKSSNNLIVFNKQCNLNFM